MKAITSNLVATALPDKTSLAAWNELFKIRLTTLVVLSTLAGFYMGAPGPLDVGLLLHALTGTALVACGAAALNQWWEREQDALMLRTQDRPLPSGALRPETAVKAGVLAAAAGLVQLAWGVNLLTAGLAALTLVLYLFVYTPLKRVTTLNTIVGAVPGALPPLMGWTAATGAVTREGLALFAIQFFWQMPHFLAIAWLYRDDYARGGYRMLPVVEPGGRSTARQALTHTVGLLPASLLPAFLGMAGRVYFIGALGLGLVFLWMTLQFAQDLSRESARRMFFASLLYLPAVLGLMALDRIG